MVLIYPEYCDKRGISDLNSIACKPCQTKEAGITLAQLSNITTLAVNSESVEVEEVQENSNLNLKLVGQENTIIQT